MRQKKLHDHQKSQHSRVHTLKKSPLEKERKSYALRIHPRRELRKVVSLAEKPPPLPPARLELGTF